MQDLNIATSELIKAISNQTIIFSYINSCIANDSNVKYICFNLLKLSFIAGFTNYNCCCPSVITKIFNFLYNI